MIAIQNVEHEKLTIKNWLVNKNEPWCVLGRNGSGKQYLDQLLMGQLQPDAIGELALPPLDKIAMVSFETQQRIYEHEIKIDATDYLNANDVGTKAKDFLPEDKLTDPLISEFG
jgi:molybdate transport system ATP-binding protein